MYIETDYSESFEEMDLKSKDICQQLLQFLTPLAEPKEYAEVGDLFGTHWPQDRFYTVIDGCVCFEQQGNTLFHFDQGDMIGLLPRYGRTESRYFTDQFVELQAYLYTDLEKVIKESEAALELWNKWQASNLNKLIILYSLNPQKENKAALGFEHYNKDDVIISEGEPATEVYAIVDGHAKVMVNGVKVGEVLEEEIFGAMSLLTNSPRSATVIATERCTVLVVPRDQFKTLMQTHPNICVNLLESLARNIVSLNQQVILLRDQGNSMAQV
ncbi:MAG: cyclic nucleotide-binding domain-containing protein [Pseudomonadales bacterium]|nr:cyclic nucleotide-binding domain-containing protein [Pseudomonadales bacterium]